MAALLLVEKVVVDFDLAVGLKVIGQQHDGNGNLVQIVDLRRNKERQVALTPAWGGSGRPFKLQTGPPKLQPVRLGDGTGCVNPV